MAMHYTYVLRSGQDEGFYTGCTSDLRQHYSEHASGRVRSTSHRRPLALVYYEASLSRDDALRRERFLKSGKGKRYLRTRLAGYLGSLSVNKLEGN
jgi:putative endonuclease